MDRHAGITASRLSLERRPPTIVQGDQTKTALQQGRRRRNQPGKGDVEMCMPAGSVQAILDLGTPSDETRGIVVTS